MRAKEVFKDWLWIYPAIATLVLMMAVVVGSPLEGLVGVGLAAPVSYGLMLMVAGE